MDELLDASEVVGLLRKAVTKAQEAGEVADRREGTFLPDDQKISPASFFTSHREYADANAMASLDEGDFERVITLARDEGNLSRANVAAKAREIARPQKARPRPADMSKQLSSTEPHSLHFVLLKGLTVRP